MGEVMVCKAEFYLSAEHARLSLAELKARAARGGIYTILQERVLDAYDIASTLPKPWVVETDDIGNIVYVGLEEDRKYYQSDLPADLEIFSVLGPYVEEGSYIDFTLGVWDGSYERHRWAFNGQGMVVEADEAWGSDEDADEDEDEGVEVDEEGPPFETGLPFVPSPEVAARIQAGALAKFESTVCLRYKLDPFLLQSRDLVYGHIGGMVAQLLMLTPGASFNRARRDGEWVELWFTLRDCARILDTAQMFCGGLEASIEFFDTSSGVKLGGAFPLSRAVPDESSEWFAYLTAVSHMAERYGIPPIDES